MNLTPTALGGRAPDKARDMPSQITEFKLAAIKAFALELDFYWKLW